MQMSEQAIIIDAKLYNNLIRLFFNIIKVPNQAHINNNIYRSSLKSHYSKYCADLKQYFAFKNKNNVNNNNKNALTTIKQ